MKNDLMSISCYVADKTPEEPAMLYRQSAKWIYIYTKYSSPSKLHFTAVTFQCISICYSTLPSIRPVYLLATEVILYISMENGQ